MIHPRTFISIPTCTSILLRRRFQATKQIGNEMLSFRLKWHPYILIRHTDIIL